MVDFLDRTQGGATIYDRGEPEEKEFESQNIVDQTFSHFSSPTFGIEEKINPLY